MSELLMAVIVFVILIFVAYPLFSRKDIPIEHKEQNPLLAEKQYLLEAVKEAEFDFHAGKLSQNDYDDLRSSLELKLFSVMQKLTKGAPGKSAKS